jgi:predicted transcriptional regulator
MNTKGQVLININRDEAEILQEYLHSGTVALDELDALIKKIQNQLEAQDIK